ncbi:hypothetical protein Mapa_007347 [Marchantia paleacea]|nr:hypothetical protein Mapa_007347 [Marchantia paleacea]
MPSPLLLQSPDSDAVAPSSQLLLLLLILRSALLPRRCALGAVFRLELWPTTVDSTPLYCANENLRCIFFPGWPLQRRRPYACRSGSGARSLLWGPSVVQGRSYEVAGQGRGAGWFELGGELLLYCTCSKECLQGAGGVVVGRREGGREGGREGTTEEEGGVLRREVFLERVRDADSTRSQNLGPTVS